MHVASRQIMRAKLCEAHQAHNGETEKKVWREEVCHV